MSKLGKLNSRDFINGAFGAVFSAVATTLLGLTSQASFNIFTVDWQGILMTALNVAVLAFVGYIGHSLTKSEDGRTFGKI